MRIDKEIARFLIASDISLTLFPSRYLDALIKTVLTPERIPLIPFIGPDMMSKASDIFLRIPTVAIKPPKDIRLPQVISLKLSMMLFNPPNIEVNNLANASCTSGLAFVIPSAKPATINPPIAIITLDGE